MENKIDLIHEILRTQKELINNSPTAPQNYLQLNDCVQQLEWQQEIKFLYAMSTKPSKFEEEFKKRCKKREIDLANCIPFHIMPQSVSNELYWRITLYWFKPKTVWETVQIISPKNHFKFKRDVEDSYSILENNYLLNSDKTKCNQQPANLVKYAMKLIKLRSPKDLLRLLLDYPPEQYELLLANINIREDSVIFEEITDVAKNKNLTLEQKRALVIAFVVNYARFNLEEQFFQNLLNAFPRETLLSILQGKSYSGDTALHLLVSERQIFSLTFCLIPKDQRFDAVKATNKSGQTVMHVATKYPKTMKTLLKLLPSKKHPEAIMLCNKMNTPALHFAALNHETLDIVISFYPGGSYLLEATKVRNGLNETALHYAVYNLKSLKILLLKYPEYERLNALMMLDKSERSVLSKLVHNPKSLQAILSILPEADWWNYLRVNINKQYIVDVLWQNPSFIKFAQLKCKHSNTAKCIAIYCILKERENAKHVNHFFSAKTNTSQVLRTVMILNSFQEIESRVQSFINYNPEDPISKRLHSILNHVDTIESNCNIKPMNNPI